jgi:7-carboxy-7-deazaguanine synthase
MNENFPVHEIFTSVQGESTDTGKPCLFIRFFGCNLNCAYCDQPQEEGYTVYSLLELVTYVSRESKARYICITGGEPLIHKNTLLLARRLTNIGFHVSIETNGTLKLPPVGLPRDYKFVMDIKCPSSKVRLPALISNFDNLREIDEVKFVISDKKDFLFAVGMLDEYPKLLDSTIIFSPVFKDNKIAIDFDLVGEVVERRLPVRVMIQTHKFLGVK